MNNKIYQDRNVQLVLAHWLVVALRPFSEPVLSLLI